MVSRDELLYSMLGARAVWFREGKLLEQAAVRLSKANPSSPC